MIKFTKYPSPFRGNLSNKFSFIIIRIIPAQPLSTNVSTKKKPIRKLLIANRGEIACRIMQTAKKMGVTTVAVFSDADTNSLHVRNADEAFHIGASASQESYLNKQRILDVAKRSGADAIHPGYGFLSENVEFAETCERENVIFIGPPPSAIRDMGLKNKAKALMASAGVPIIVGYHGADQSDAKLKEEAKRIGYPVMLKAVRGGGGKGMRIALKESDFDTQLESARREAMKSFGNDEMIVEKFVARPRHVEVQIFGDHYDNYVYLFERDCSVQRRHQKIIEEAPAPGLDEATRRSLGESAVKAARAVNYVGAGTVEFIMDPDKRFYFMEMNTRLQVEHPVSEMITGLDFVEWQLRVASGEPLPIAQEAIVANGHSFEARIYAEDTENNFMPAPGVLSHLDVGSLADSLGVRVETGVQEGDEISVHYDPMICKLVVWANDRQYALKKLDDSLALFHVAGLKTNVNFLRNLAKHPEFQEGNVYTDFISDYGKELFDSESEFKSSSSPENLAAFAGGLLLLDKSVLRSSDPFGIPDQFRVNSLASKTVKVDIGERRHSEFEIVYENASIGRYSLNLASSSLPFRIFNPQHRLGSTCHVVTFNIEFGGRISKVKLVKIRNSGDNDHQVFKLFTNAGAYDYRLPSPQWVKEMITSSGLGDSHNPTAPMPGVIEKVLVKAGQRISEGDPLVVMVAMKMEYTIKAPHAGVVEKVLCKTGDNVPKGAQVILFKGGDSEEVKSANND